MSAMLRPFTVTFENVAVAALQDFFEIRPADDRSCAVYGLTIGNVGGTADMGDAQEEALRLSIIRGHTTSGSGGSVATPRPLGGHGETAGFAAEVNNTTQATVGTTHTLWADGHNVRIPGTPGFFPEEAWCWVQEPETSLVVRLHANPADSIQLSGTLWVMEEAT